MGYWKSKVLPKIKKLFEKDGTKKAGAAEACKAFDESKEEITKEVEEKKIELQPKVVEIYEASTTEVKTVVKERKDAGLKKHSAAVQKFLDELAKIGFPGSKQVSEASTKFGPTLVCGPVFFVFEKVSTFIVTEEKEVAATTTKEEVVEKKEKEIVVEEKKEEEVVKKEEVEEVTTKSEEPATSSDPPKVAEEEAPKP